MREIVPGRLWMGNRSDAEDVSSVLRLGIVVIIDLAMEEPPIQYPRDIVYCRFPLVDGSGNRAEFIRAAVHVTASFIEAAVPTLITCGAGMSRAPIIAAAALAVIEQKTIEETLEGITTEAVHDVSTSLWCEVKDAVVHAG